jgi:uncharacterized RDD family membrane protein YckC
MASAEYSILTPERVKLQYDIAGIGSRGAAAIVDTTIQALAVTIMLVALSAGGLAVSAFVGGGAGAVALGVGLLSLGVFAVTGGYFMLFEILWNGQTPGKRLVGLRVIRENGYPIRPVDAVIRNLIRIVDWLPMAYGFGVLTMLLNSRSRRLGDFASGTLVVREGQSAGAAAIILPTTAGGRVLALSPAEARLVRDFLARRATMHPRARADVATRLAVALARRYALPLESEPEPFLEQLAG